MTNRNLHSRKTMPALLVLTALALISADAAQWNATVGAQSNDKGDQALAFLPNEIWIHAGDRIHGRSRRTRFIQ
jgi:hypothetical protein